MRVSLVRTLFSEAPVVLQKSMPKLDTEKPDPTPCFHTVCKTFGLSSTGYEQRHSKQQP